MKISYNYFLAIFFIGCGSMQSNEGTVSNIDATILTVSVDPICKMDMKEYAITDTAVYNNDIIGFCSPGCKEKFKDNPEKYINK